MKHSKFVRFVVYGLFATSMLGVFLSLIIGLYGVYTVDLGKFLMGLGQACIFGAPCFWTYEAISLYSLFATEEKRKSKELAKQNEIVQDYKNKKNGKETSNPIIQGERNGTR